MNMDASLHAVNLKKMSILFFFTGLVITLTVLVRIIGNQYTVIVLDNGLNKSLNKSRGRTGYTCGIRWGRT